MTDHSPEQLYERWIAKRREVEVDSALVDDVMGQIIPSTDRLEESRWIRILQRIEESWTARCIAYGGAMAIGCLPFILAIQVSRL